MSRITFFILSFLIVLITRQITYADRCFSHESSFCLKHETKKGIYTCLVSQCLDGLNCAPSNKVRRCVSENCKCVSECYDYEEAIHSGIRNDKVCVKRTRCKLNEREDCLKRNNCPKLYTRYGCIYENGGHRCVCRRIGHSMCPVPDDVVTQCVQTEDRDILRCWANCKKSAINKPFKKYFCNQETKRWTPTVPECERTEPICPIWNLPTRRVNCWKTDNPDISRCRTDCGGWLDGLFTVYTCNEKTKKWLEFQPNCMNVKCETVTYPPTPDYSDETIAFEEPTTIEESFMDGPMGRSRDEEEISESLNCLYSYQYKCRSFCGWKNAPPCSLSELIDLRHAYVKRNHTTRAKPLAKKCFTLKDFSIECELTCPPNYRFDGERFNVCQLKGSWSRPMPDCIRTQFDGSLKLETCSNREMRDCQGYRKSKCPNNNLENHCTRNYNTYRLECGCGKTALKLTNEEKWMQETCSQLEMEYCEDYVERMCPDSTTKNHCTRNYYTRRLDCGCEMPDHRWTCSYPFTPVAGSRVCEGREGLWTCTYRCDSTELGLIGDQVQTCGPYSDWSGVPPSCVVLNCDKDGLSKKCYDGRCSCERDSECDYSKHKRCHQLKCMCVGGSEISFFFGYTPTYYRDQEAFLYKDSNLCRDAKTPKYGAKYCSLKFDDPNAITGCVFSCNGGYAVKGPARSKCNAKGEWDVQKITCEECTDGVQVCHRYKNDPRIICECSKKVNDADKRTEKIILIPNGWMRCSKNGRCHYACDPGTKLIGESRTTLLFDGTFSPKQARCQVANVCPMSIKMNDAIVSSFPLNDLNQKNQPLKLWYTDIKCNRGMESQGLGFSLLKTICPSDYGWWTDNVPWCKKELSSLEEHWKKEGVDCVPLEFEYCRKYAEEMCPGNGNPNYCSKNKRTAQLNCFCRKPNDRRIQWTCPIPEQPPMGKKLKCSKNARNIWECKVVDEGNEYDNTVTDIQLCLDKKNWTKAKLN